MQADLEEGIEEAILAAARLLETQEPWALRDSSLRAGHRLLSLLFAIIEARPSADLPHGVKRETLNVLPYLSADVRLGILCRLAADAPDLVDSLMSGQPDARMEPARYNVFHTLGSFARMALLSDIFTEERLDRIRDVITKGETT